VAIIFPKLTSKIKITACGSSHILALTENGDLYSWGSGSYGALGFGSRDDI